MNQATISTLFTSEQCNFAIQLPAVAPAPKWKESTVTTAAGLVRSVQYLSDLQTKIWAVSYFEYPQNILKLKSVNQFLDDVAEGSRKAINGKVFKVTDFVWQNKYKAKSVDMVSVDGNQQLYIRADSIMVGTTVYLIVFGSNTSSDLESAETNQYYNSFKLLRDL